MKFANRRRLYQITTILVLVLFFLPAMATDKKPSDEKVAVVNGVVISRIQFDKELKVHIERVSRQGRQTTDDQMEELKKDVLEGLIEREVLYQESQKAGIKITDQKVDDQVAAIKKRFPGDTVVFSFPQSATGHGDIKTLGFSRLKSKIRNPPGCQRRTDIA